MADETSQLDQKQITQLKREVGDLVAALNIAGGTFADFQKAADKAMGQAATKAKAMADSMGTM